MFPYKEIQNSRFSHFRNTSLFSWNLMKITKITLYGVVSFALYVLNAIYAVHTVGSMLIHITLYSSCIGTARRLRCICHSYHTMNKILNILRILNPTTHKLPTHTWHGSLFLLFLQLAIQKIFIFVFTLNNLLNGCEFRCGCCDDIFEHLCMTPERLPGSGLTSWVV